MATRLITTPKPLGQAQAGAGRTLVYQAPSTADFVAAVARVRLVNNSDAGRTFLLCAIPPAGPFDATTAILPIDMPLPKKSVYHDSGIVVGPDWTIEVSADVADQITVTIDGAEVTQETV